jgi:hypothetical protein
MSVKHGGADSPILQVFLRLGGTLHDGELGEYPPPSSSQLHAPKAPSRNLSFTLPFGPKQLAIGDSVRHDGWRTQRPHRKPADTDWCPRISARPAAYGLFCFDSPGCSAALVRAKLQQRTFGIEVLHAVPGAQIRACTACAPNQRPRSDRTLAEYNPSAAMRWLPQPARF